MNNYDDTPIDEPVTREQFISMGEDINIVFNRMIEYMIKNCGCENTLHNTTDWVVFKQDDDGLYRMVFEPNRFTKDKVKVNPKVGNEATS